MDPWARCILPDDISYEEWVRFVFDHPILDPSWWWQFPATGYLKEWNTEADRTRTLSYLTQLFEKPEGLIGKYSREQIDQGLSYLVNNCCSSHMFVLSNAKLPWADRRRCFDGMIPLYTKLMAPIYGDDLGHNQYGPADRPNFACYMWWDVIPIYGGMEHTDRDRINDAVLNVFQQVLKLKSEACLESVLHGLGHWHQYRRTHTAQIVQRFLGRTDLSPELRRYAELAATGSVQ